MSEHSPVPWTWDGTFPICIRDAEGNHVVSPGGIYAIYPSGEANAKFIIRAGNSHEELLETLKLARAGVRWAAKDVEGDDSHSWDFDAVLSRVDAAIAKATGETR